MNKRNLFLTVLKMEKSKIKTQCLERELVTIDRSPSCVLTWKKELASFLGALTRMVIPIHVGIALMI
jgi:hypothetical protein